MRRPQPTLTIDEHRSETDYALGILRDYLDVVEQALTEYEPGAKKALETKWRSIQGQFVRAASEKIDHIIRFSETYPTTLRYSFLIQLFVVFESRGKALCDEIKHRNSEIRLSLSDLGGGGSYRGIRTFLSKVYPVSEITSQQWDELNCLRVIRNCLIHTNGLVGDDKSEKDARRLKQIIQSEDGVSLLADKFLRIERVYCDRALKSVGEFFKTVFSKASFGTSYFAAEAKAAREIPAQTSE